MDKTEIKKAAEKLKAEGLSQKKIAKQLGVSQTYIWKLLSKKKRKTPVLDRARDIVRPLLREGLPTNSRVLQEEHGISHVHLETAIAVERTLHEEPPEIEPSTLSLSAQEKLAAAIRQHQRQLDATFEKRVADAVRQSIDDTVLPHYNEKLKLYNRVLAARTGLGSMDRKTYNLIRSCLHADSRLSVSEDRLNRAFHAWSDMEVVMLPESLHPTTNTGFVMPATFADLMERRRARQSKRTVNPVKTR
jgi:transcriptional regulator with XRE-family HTH domain